MSRHWKILTASNNFDDVLKEKKKKRREDKNDKPHALHTHTGSGIDPTSEMHRRKSGCI